MKENKSILKERMKEFNKINKPKVGEFLKFEGEYVRFTHDWEDSLQTGEGDSFYLNCCGRLSYSGSLNHGVQMDVLEVTKERRKGKVWFFDKDIAGAGRGVDFLVPFRVWKIKRTELKGVDPYEVFGRDLCPKCKSTKYFSNSLDFTSACEECGFKEVEA